MCGALVVSFLNNMPQFKVMTWQPKKHLRYWMYTFLLRLPLNKKWKCYWFIKRCNFINKPLLDVLIKVKPLPKDHWEKVAEELEKVWDDDFSWEIITNKQQ